MSINYQDPELAKLLDAFYEDISNDMEYLVRMAQYRHNTTIKQLINEFYQDPDALPQMIAGATYLKNIPKKERTEEQDTRLKHLNISILKLTQDKLPAYLKDKLARTLAPQDLTPIYKIPFALIMPYSASFTSASRDKYICPLHKEKTPSFTVFHDKNRFHCFGCQEHGNTISFIMKHLNLPLPDAINHLKRYI